MSTVAEEPRRARTVHKRSRRPRRTTALFAHGEPLVWLTGGALALALAMIVSLLALVAWEGASTFWPLPVARFETHAGRAWMGEVSGSETYSPPESVIAALPESAARDARAALERSGGEARRRLLRIGNYELTGEHFRWVSDFEIARETHPRWALVVERDAGGRFYGTPKSFLVDGVEVATGPERALALYSEHHDLCRARAEERVDLETHAIGAVNREEERARLALRGAEIEHGRASPEFEGALAEFERTQGALRARYEEIERRIAALDRENARYQVVLETADGTVKPLVVAEIVRAYAANGLSFVGAVRLFLSRWWEFLSAVPREANSEGGVFPAIFGTVVMTLVMSLLVVPFGVLAALYLREYAKPGPLVSTVRIAVNNLAGVPSIVFGVFGLGFFCYLVGASIDQLFYEARLPNPTYGKGGILWASLTLALLTLPVVIVATEEALAAVPGSMREGSYACGATKWQTIQRIVLPRAMPGIMTGMILAIARGAGEVAPLMLVGAVKLAPELAVDGVFPYVHLERSFLHLGFHIYDLGFQSQNSEAAKPMVFTTTLLLIGLIVGLNVTAIWVRGRLRAKFTTGQV